MDSDSMFIQKNPYDTSKIDFQDIYELIDKRNFEQENPLTINYAVNYGIEPSLKTYAGFSPDYEVKGFIEHGIAFTSATVSAYRVHEYLPTFTSSPFREKCLTANKNNGVYTVGPYIAYAKSLLNKNELKIERERLGKNLLVFPAHATVETHFEYNLKMFADKIREIAEDFDSVRVCLYWKDVERGLGEFYKEEGFEVVSAGYAKDPLFLRRLRSIIETSHTTISNDLGSTTGYCIHLKKPHYLINMDVSLENNDEREKNIKNIYDNYIRNIIFENTDFDMLEEIKEILSNEDNLNNRQFRDFMNEYYGLNQVKSEKELRNMLLDAEEKFSKTGFYLSLPKTVFLFGKMYLKSLIYYLKNK